MSPSTALKARPCCWPWPISRCPRVPPARACTRNLRTCSGRSAAATGWRRVPCGSAWGGSRRPRRPTTRRPGSAPKSPGSGLASPVPATCRGCPGTMAGTARTSCDDCMPCLGPVLSTRAARSSKGGLATGNRARKLNCRSGSSMGGSRTPASGHLAAPTSWPRPPGSRKPSAAAIGPSSRPGTGTRPRRALDVPPAKFGRLLTVQDALRAAVRNWPGAPGSTV